MGNKENFEGFEMPNFTQTPNKFFDDVVQEIDTLSEMKVTLMIIRNTFGWHKRSDRISQTQLVEDTGMSKDSVKRGLKKGIKRGTIVKVSEYDAKTRTAAEYSLNFKAVDVKEEDIPYKSDLTGGQDNPQGDNTPEAGGQDNPETPGQDTGEQNKDLNKELNKNNEDDEVKNLSTKEEEEIIKKYQSRKKAKKNNEDTKHPINKAMINKWKLNAGEIYNRINQFFYLKEKSEQLSLDIVLKAMEDSKYKNNPFDYCKTLLDDWLNRGITNISELNGGEDNGRSGSHQGSNGGQRPGRKNKENQKEESKNEPKFTAGTII